MRTDCFACIDGCCRVLRQTDCKGCKFYKTEQQFKDDQNAMAKRIAKKYGISYEKVIEIKGLKKG